MNHYTQSHRVEPESPLTEPAVVQLHGCIKEIGRRELDRYLKKAGLRNDESVRELEAMISRIADRIALPIVAGIAGEGRETVSREERMDMVRRTCSAFSAPQR